MLTVGMGSTDGCHENPTAWRINGTGVPSLEDVSALASTGAGTTKVPSSEFGVKDRFCRLAAGEDSLLLDDDAPRLPYPICASLSLPIRCMNTFTGEKWSQVERLPAGETR